MEYQTIVKDSSRGYDIDQLNGKDLINGERLEIQWPDGSITKEIIFVRGKPFFADKEAVVAKRILGVHVAVTICGLSAKRV